MMRRLNGLVALQKMKFRSIHSNQESMQRITYLGNYQLIVYSQQFMKLNHDTVSAIVGLCGLSDGC